MTKLLFILSFLFSTTVWGQTRLDSVMSKATCDCLSTLNFGTQDGVAFNTCFNKSLDKDTILMQNECKKLYGDTSEESAHKFGEDFFKRNSVNLVYTCDVYFKFLDSTRYTQINSINKDSIRSSIAALNSTDPGTWDKEFLVKRGLFYFALADYVNAQKDLDSSLALDPNTIQSIYFKAWICEINKDYDCAIKLYTDLATLTRQNDFNVFVAIARRKKSGL